jgi:hypothetical protein
MNRKIKVHAETRRRGEGKRNRSRDEIALVRECGGLTGLDSFWGRFTWASARRTRFSPGYQIAGFQPWNNKVGSWAVSGPEGNAGFSLKLKTLELTFSDWRGLTSHPQSLSPLRGERSALDRRNCSLVERRCCDGAHGVTRLSKVGLWAVSGSERNKGLSMNRKSCDGRFEKFDFWRSVEKRRSTAAVQDASRVRTVASVSFVQQHGYDGGHGVTRATKVGPVAGRRSV